MTAAQAAIHSWVPGDNRANVGLWEGLAEGEDGLSGHQVVDIMAELLTYISAEVGVIDSKPGSHLESEWRSAMGDDIGQAILTSLACWQECDDPRIHLYENVRMIATADFMSDGNLTERVLCCLLDLAGSLREGSAKMALLDDEGVRVIR